MKKSITLAMIGCLGVASLAQIPAKLSPRMSAAMMREDARRDSVVSVYITIGEGADINEISRYAGNLNFLTRDIATARVLMSDIQRLSELEGVKYLQTGIKGKQQLDLARGVTGVDKVHSGEGLENPYTGKGVVIGIVDAGFDYCHSAFYDAEGNCRIKRVWEQGTTPSAGQRSPERFGYGLELSSPEELRGAGGDIANNSHGTHVAGIAGGSNQNQFTGMAPDAEYVFVSMNTTGSYDVNISNGIAYIFDYADEVGKPCVVNLSLGYQAGPHDGTSTFDRIVDGLTGDGKVIVGASGNNRADKFHVMKEFESADAEPLRTFLDFRNRSRLDEGEAEVWASGDVEIALLCYKTNTKEVVNRVVLFPADETSFNASLGSNVTGDFTVSSEINGFNGKRHVYLSSNLTSIRANYAVALEVVPKERGQVDIWADNNNLGLDSKKIESFAAPGDESTLNEIGGTANSILTVGAFTTRKDYVLVNETKVNSLNETVGDLSSFSSFGPTADGRQKPEVTAPGCFIISAISNNGGCSYIAEVSQGDGRWNNYGYMQGTSMACPMVAGIVATWLQANPNLNPEQLKEIVAATAQKDDFTGSLLPARMWGYGKIDALAGVKKALTMSGVSPVIADNAPFGVALTVEGKNLKFDFLQSGDAIIDIYDVVGEKIHSAGHGAALGDTMVIDMSSLPSGIYLAVVRIGGRFHTFKLKL